MSAPAPTARVRVWDVPTRIFHWSLVLSFVTAFATADSERLRNIHVIAGYSMGGLLGFRLLWGVVGGSYSRFTAFWPTPARLLNYLQSLFNGQPEHHVGHNPAGAVAILLMIVIGLTSVFSGWALYDEIDLGWITPWLEDLHELAGNGMMALVVIHIIGVVVSSWLHHENLVKAMVTGIKELPAPHHENPAR